jgi:3-deoxy-manno-octulosonate cytidylyltransferase (CMP-KDO synthetase)
MKSTRLPGKPLIPLLGVSMIRRTYNQCVKAVPAELVLVATDDPRIEDHCREAGINVVMTPQTCLTGTDRVAHVARKIDADIYINVQGDEPVIDPADILKAVDAAKRYPGEIINGMCAITEQEEFRQPSIPKLVARPDGRLLYMSRAPIPTTKDLAFVTAWRQICIYGFPKKALLAFADYGRKGVLEALEDVEILRFLEMGYDVRMVEMSDSSIAVDRPEDVARAEQAIRERKL